MSSGPDGSVPNYLPGTNPEQVQAGQELADRADKRLDEEHRPTVSVDPTIPELTENSPVPAEIKELLRRAANEQQ